ncbi:MAG: hypothetical protein NC131_09975 [Roseburia sp.]|nr:hypothetical protein [Roseburia sp.]
MREWAGVQLFITTIIFIVGVCLIVHGIRSYKEDHSRLKVIEFCIYGTLCIFAGIVVLGSFAGTTCTGIELVKDAEIFEAEGDYYNAYWTYISAQRLVPNASLQEEIDRLENPALYETAKRYTEEGDYYGAYNAYLKIPDYLDSNELAEECMLQYLQQKHPDWFE